MKCTMDESVKGFQLMTKTFAYQKFANIIYNFQIRPENDFHSREHFHEFFEKNRNG